MHIKLFENESSESDIETFLNTLEESVYVSIKRLWSLNHEYV